MIYPDKVYIPVVRGCSAGNVFLSAVDAWDWIHLFRSYHGKVYTAAEIGSIREVNTK